MSFRYNFWNSSGVFHDRLLEEGLIVNSNAYYYKLTHIACQYRYHYDMTVESCGPSLLHGNARAYLGF